MPTRSLSLARKTIVGVVHLLPLPGAPYYRGSMDEVIERAARDASALERGGVDALIIENFRDAPFWKERVPPETIAAMTVAARAVAQSVPLPLGINVLRNDAHAALAIAVAVGGRFVRINVHTGAANTDQGIIEGRAASTLRLRRTLTSSTAPRASTERSPGGEGHIQIWADVFVKHAAPLANTSLRDNARDTVLRGHADALIVTGAATGAVCNLDDVRQVKEALPFVPVLVGSGVTKDTIRDTLKIADGVIVGTSMKTDGVVINPVDLRRVQRLVAASKKRKA